MNGFLKLIFCCSDSRGTDWVSHVVWRIICRVAIKHVEEILQFIHYLLP